MVSSASVSFIYLSKNRLEFISNFERPWKLNSLYLLRIEPTNPTKPAIRKSVYAHALTHNTPIHIQTELFLYGLYKMISNSKYDLKRGIRVCLSVKIHINSFRSCSGVYFIYEIRSLFSCFSFFYNERPLIAIPKTECQEKRFSTFSIHLRIFQFNLNVMYFDF